MTILRKAAFAAVGWIMLGASAALADPLDDRVKELLPWVAEKTGYKAEQVKVTVIRVEPRTITSIAYGIRQDNGPEPEAVTAGATIFLPTSFRLGRNDDVLVHELVHVLQYANDARFRCRSEQEKQAYETQSAYVEEAGIGTKPDPFAVFLLHCTAYPVRYPSSLKPPG